MRSSDWSSDVCSSDLIGVLKFWSANPRASRGFKPPHTSFKEFRQLAPPAFAGHGTFVSKESQISNVTGQRDRKAAQVSARLLAGASIVAVVLLAMASPAQAPDAARNWDANGPTVDICGTGTWTHGKHT